MLVSEPRWVLGKGMTECTTKSSDMKVVEVHLPKFWLRTVLVGGVLDVVLGSVGVTHGRGICPFHPALCAIRCISLSRVAHNLSGRTNPWRRTKLYRNLVQKVSKSSSTVPSTWQFPLLPRNCLGIDLLIPAVSYAAIPSHVEASVWHAISKTHFCWEPRRFRGLEIPSAGGVLEVMCLPFKSTLPQATCSWNFVCMASILLSLQTCGCSRKVLAWSKTRHLEGTRLR